MTGSEYQRQAMRTNDRQATGRVTNAIEWILKASKPIDIGGLFDACLGLSGEVGELNDIVKKWIFHESNFNTEHMKKELGDVMWYVAMFCESMNWDLNEILSMNIEKLKMRYPEGFSVERANNRKVCDI